MRKEVVQLYINNNKVIFSLAWNIIFFDNFKSSCFEIFGDKEHGIFEPKRWSKYDIYWLLKSPCFNLFGNGKYDLFLSQKVDGNMMFTDYWKVLVLNFKVIGNAVFSLSQEVDGKMIFTGYWEVLVLNFSVMANTVFFFSQKVDGKMIFTWSFWVFYDIPGPGKYGFSRSGACWSWWRLSVSSPVIFLKESCYLGRI